MSDVREDSSQSLTYPSTKTRRLGREGDARRKRSGGRPTGASDGGVRRGKRRRVMRDIDEMATGARETHPS